MQLEHPPGTGNSGSNVTGAHYIAGLDMSWRATHFLIKRICVIFFPLRAKDFRSVWKAWRYLLCGLKLCTGTLLIVPSALLRWHSGSFSAARISVIARVEIFLLRYSCSWHSALFPVLFLCKDCYIGYRKLPSFFAGLQAVTDMYSAHTDAMHTIRSNQQLPVPQLYDGITVL